LTRQDSATLPLGDHFSKPPYWRDKSSSGELNLSSTSGRESPILTAPSVPFGVNRTSIGPKGSHRFRGSPEKHRGGRLQITTNSLTNPFPESSQNLQSSSQEATRVRNNAQALSRILEGSSTIHSMASTPLPIEVNENTSSTRPSPYGEVSSVGDSPSPPAASESEIASFNDTSALNPTDQSFAWPPGSPLSSRSIDSTVNGYSLVLSAKRKGSRLSSSSKGSKRSSTRSSLRNSRKWDSKANIRKGHTAVSAQSGRSGGAFS
jgi:hypothetical protein